MAKQPFKKYRVGSERDESVKYVITHYTDHSYACSCPGWIYKHVECKHIRLVQRHEQSRTTRVRDAKRKATK